MGVWRGRARLFKKIRKRLFMMSGREIDDGYGTTLMIIDYIFMVVTWGLRELKLRPVEVAILFCGHGCSTVLFFKKMLAVFNVWALGSTAIGLKSKGVVVVVEKSITSPLLLSFSPNHFLLHKLVYTIFSKSYLSDFALAYEVYRVLFDLDL
ncbi:hypothetical protein C5167_027144 [Papaver somniferum]|nr:hypothetical protein C5167_027144 [Papaver somniferum]